MPRTNLTREAYTEIRSGKLSVREAKQKYHISQARYQKIRGSCETTNKEKVYEIEKPDTDKCKEETNKCKCKNESETAWKYLVDNYKHLFLSDAEKQILENGGYEIYERYKIPRQFIEFYKIIFSHQIKNGQILDFLYIYQPHDTRPSSGKL